MDALFWEPNWKQSSDDVFFERLADAIANDRWVLDGNYARTSQLKWVIFSRDSIFVFAYRTHATLRSRYAPLVTTPPRPDLTFVHLRSPREAEQFLAGLGPTHVSASANRASGASVS